MSTFRIHSAARQFAISHKINLGRHGQGSGAKTGYYFIGGEFLSYQPTAQSALAMMKRYRSAKR